MRVDDSAPTSPLSAGRRLRGLLHSGQTLLLPGVFNALSARLATESGFGALYMTGFGVSASRGAFPDNGSLTMVEMVDTAAAVVEATTLPVLADGDTGYGHMGNIARTVQRHERAGVAGIHLEDTVWPKHRQEVVSRREMQERIDAALEARLDPDFVLVGRTDSYDSLGRDEAFARARLLERAGVDAVFVHSLTRKDDFRRLRQEVGIPLVMNVIEDVTEPESLAEVSDLGYEIGIFAIAALRAMMRTGLEIYSQLARGGLVSKEPLLTLEQTTSLLSTKRLASKPMS